MNEISKMKRDESNSILVLFLKFRSFLLQLQTIFQLFFHFPLVQGVVNKILKYE